MTLGGSTMKMIFRNLFFIIGFVFFLFVFPAVGNTVADDGDIKAEVGLPDAPQNITIAIKPAKIIHNKVIFSQVDLLIMLLFALLLLFFFSLCSKQKKQG